MDLSLLLGTGMHVDAPGALLADLNAWISDAWGPRGDAAGALQSHRNSLAIMERLTESDTYNVG